MASSIYLWHLCSHCHDKQSWHRQDPHWDGTFQKNCGLLLRGGRWGDADLVISYKSFFCKKHQVHSWEKPDESQLVLRQPEKLATMPQHPDLGQKQFPQNINIYIYRWRHAANGNELATTQYKKRHVPSREHHWASPFFSYRLIICMFFALKRRMQKSTGRSHNPRWREWHGSSSAQLAKTCVFEMGEKKKQGDSERPSFPRAHRTGLASVQNLSGESLRDSSWNTGMLYRLPMGQAMSSMGLGPRKRLQEWCACSTPICQNNSVYILSQHCAKSRRHLFRIHMFNKWFNEFHKCFGMGKIKPFVKESKV